MGLRTSPRRDDVAAFGRLELMNPYEKIWIYLVWSDRQVMVIYGFPIMI